MKSSYQQFALPKYRHCDYQTLTSVIRCYSVSKGATPEDGIVWRLASFKDKYFYEN